MNKLIKNSELIKRALFVAFSVVLILISIVYFSLSFSLYDDGWGTDISFDQDAVVLFICSVALCVYSVCNLLALKNNISTKNVYYSSFGVIGVLLFCYPLGVFFKELSKALSSGEAFDYSSYQDYLYLGLLGLILVLYLIFSYISDKKNK